MSNVTLWGSYPSPAASVGAVSSQREGFSIFLSLQTWLVFQPRHRLLDRGLPLLLTDQLLLIPAMDHGPPGPQTTQRLPDLHWQSIREAARHSPGTGWLKSGEKPSYCHHSARDHN